MDTSEEYITMCRRSPDEFKQLWEPNVGDYHTWNGAISVIGRETFKNETGFELRDAIAWGDEKEYGEYIIGYYKEWVVMDLNGNANTNFNNVIGEFYATYTYEGCTWLPKQCQLQHLVKQDSFSPIDNLLYCLLSWSNDGMCAECGNNDYSKSFNSMEQLWLAFVMQEKYGKKWIPDTKEWI